MNSIDETRKWQEHLQMQLNNYPGDATPVSICKCVGNMARAILSDTYYCDDEHVISSLRLMTQIQQKLKNYTNAVLTMRQRIDDIQSKQKYRDLRGGHPRF